MIEKVLSILCLVLCLLNNNVLAQAPNNRATDMMEGILLAVAQESKNNTQPCVAAKQGPGIFTPVTAARAYHIISRAMFNAWSFYDAAATHDLKNCDTVPTTKICTTNCAEADKNETITYAAYFMYNYLLPSSVTTYGVDILFLAQYGVNVNSIGGPGTPSRIAKDVTDCLIAEFDADGSNQANCYADTTGYSYVNDPTVLDDFSTVSAAFANNRAEFAYSEIVRTGFINAPRKFLLPHAAFITAYSYDHSVNAPPPPPPTEWRIQYEDLTDIQATLTINNGLNKYIAEFWADGPRTTTPPGHWIELAEGLVINRKNYDLDNSIRLYYILAAANYDAAIAVWKQKRLYNTARPATYIPTFFLNNNYTNQYRGPYCPFDNIQGYEWQPYQLPTFITPAFPEYTSGHSAFSAASARVLALWTGSDTLPNGTPYSVVVPEGRSLIEPQCYSNNTNMFGEACTFKACGLDGSFDSENSYGPQVDITLGPWDTFTDMALSAGISRLYGGIHISAANVESYNLGLATAQLTYDKATKHVGYLDDTLANVGASSSITPTGSTASTSDNNNGCSSAAALSSWLFY